MKILMVNKFFFVKGGSETYLFALKRELEARGHTVVDFSMKDGRNRESPYASYFVENVDYDRPGGLWQKAKAACHILYSREAKKKFRALVEAEKPDLIHLHLFQHQISPSILDVIREYRIPTVYTAHDLKMLCPNYKMMHHGQICEDCKGGRYLACVKNCCVKDSRMKSAVSAAEGYLHKWRKSYDVIDRIITPSAFYREKFLEFGIAPRRVVHIPNFLDRDTVQSTEKKEPYYLYFGRLSQEKGLFTLTEAFSGTDRNLYIAGTGPVEEQLREKAKDHPNIRFTGFLQGQALTDLVAGAKAVILPSQWYENGPYTAIEALQMGIPVIGANIGGISELIRDNGFLFESGNVRSLQEAVEKMENTDDYEKMKAASRALFEDCYTARAHMERLLPVYEEVIREKRGSV